MAFLCSFAWADLKVREKERAFVRNVAKKFHLDAAQAQQVEDWLAVPPPAELVDPAKIPAEQRQLVLEMARAMISADGDVSQDEEDNLRLLEALLR
jgi:uncharacterized tellurite resistance protein B-like protein